jgi:hypothetical protein
MKPHIQELVDNEFDMFGGPMIHYTLMLSNQGNILIGHNVMDDNRGIHSFDILIFQGEYNEILMEEGI